MLERLKTGLIACDATKDSTNGDFSATLQVETARALIQDWAIAAIRFTLYEDTELQSETSPIAQEVCEILTAWLPDFVALNFALEISDEMHITAAPIVGVDKREGQEYLASAHLQIRIKRGEIPEGLTQILNRFKT